MVPGWLFLGPGGSPDPLSGGMSVGQLQEVAPPGAVQQIRQKLQRYQPNLQLITPNNDSVIKSDSIELMLEVRDWPVGTDSELGIGPHVAVQVDNRPALQLDEIDENRLLVRIDDLSPGSHRFSAWAAYPWGEAVKTPGAMIQGRFHLWQRTEGTQPQEKEPWLVAVTNTNGSALQPILLDWIIWNAPLQNLRDGDERWKLRLSVNDESFLVDSQEAIWLAGTTVNSDNLVQMELLNEIGEIITPVFNNQLIHQSASKTTNPIWLQAHLTDEEVIRLSGEPYAISLELEHFTEPK
ncbi:hypothetical protein [Synechococcus sp. M16CYN]|uniref:hypothetical protein n=1 Tax=Synechococcus sp. M16CYN TaxID=3103139 RepID=UPI00333F7FA4